MTTNNFFQSALYSAENIVQNTMISFPKELIVQTLRDYFSKDQYYHYVQDSWGYPNTPNHTDLPLDAGINDKITTRVFIGESFRDNVSFYPAILVRHGGANYAPYSFNRETSCVQWDYKTIEDENGNLVSAVKFPKYFIYAGGWDGSIQIDILSRSPKARDDIAEIVALILQDLAHRSLQKSGVFIKRTSVSSPSEQEDRNDKIFKVSVTSEIRSEWRRLIPVRNILEIINFAFEFGRVDIPDSPAAQNLTIYTNQDLTSSILKVL